MTPEHRNKVVVRRFVEEAWNGRNLAVISDLFAPDYSVNGVFVGIEGVKRAVESLRSIFGDASITIADLVAEGDRVVARWALQGEHRGEFMGVAPTGRQVELTGINIYRLAANTITENHEIIDIHGLLSQLVAKP